MTQSDVTPTVLLTGPTSGIGARMLESLLARTPKPRLVLVGRDWPRLSRAVASGRDARAPAHGVQADLGDLRSVSAALESIYALQEEGAIGPIDVALLNAGGQFADRRHTGAQGWELTFTVNVIAQHLLLRGLSPLLAASGHVILLGSSTHRGRRAAFYLMPDPESADPAVLATPLPAPSGPDRPAEDRRQGGAAYASSKLALVTLSHPWAAELATRGRRLNVYDPGLVAGTGLTREMPPYRYWVWQRIMPAMSILPGATTPKRAGRRAVGLGLGDIHPALQGAYVEGERIAEPAEITRDTARQKALWRWLDAATTPYLPSVAKGRRFGAA